MRVRQKSRSATDPEPSITLPVDADRHGKKEQRKSEEAEDDVYDPDWEVSDADLEEFEKLSHLDD